MRANLFLAHVWTVFVMMLDVRGSDIF